MENDHDQIHEWENNFDYPIIVRYYYMLPTCSSYVDFKDGLIILLKSRIHCLFSLRFLEIFIDWFWNFVGFSCGKWNWINNEWMKRWVTSINEIWLVETSEVDLLWKMSQMKSISIVWRRTRIRMIEWRWIFFTNSFSIW